MRVYDVIKGLLEKGLLERLKHTTDRHLQFT